MNIIRRNILLLPFLLFIPLRLSGDTGIKGKDNGKYLIPTISYSNQTGLSIKGFGKDKKPLDINLNIKNFSIRIYKNQEDKFIEFLSRQHITLHVDETITSIDCVGMSGFNINENCFTCVVSYDSYIEISYNTICIKGKIEDGYISIKE